MNTYQEVEPNFIRHLFSISKDAEQKLQELMTQSASQTSFYVSSGGVYKESTYTTWNHPLKWILGYLSHHFLIRFLIQIQVQDTVQNVLKYQC